MTQRWPAPGDIVWCRFPELPATHPGPKPRPALVIAVDERTDGVSVRVVYGTSQKVDRLRAGEFVITRLGHPGPFALAGLSHDTKFDLRASIELPWGSVFFGVAPRAPHGQTPKLGTLHPALMRAAQAAWSATRKR